jgi:SNF2 family DNA or RNA helicase
MMDESDDDGRDARLLASSVGLSSSQEAVLRETKSALRALRAKLDPERERFVCRNLAEFCPFLSSAVRRKWALRARALDLWSAELEVALAEAERAEEIDDELRLEEAAAVLLNRKSREPDAGAHAALKAQPSFIAGGTMRDYQLKGLNWLISRFDYRVGAILGDEMGLGKTLQTIAFIGYLKLVRKAPGSALVVCPLSVLSSWMAELRRWCPSLRAGESRQPAPPCPILPLLLSRSSALVCARACFLLCSQYLALSQCAFMGQLPSDGAWRALRPPRASSMCW